MSADAARGTVAIELDRPRRLRCDFNALCVLEEKAGVNLLRPTKEGEPYPLDSPSMSFIRAMLYSFLLHEMPRLTLEQAGSLINLENLPAVTSACKQAVMLAMPKRAEGDEQAATPDPPVALHPGSTSGPSASMTSAAATSGG